jgi:Ca-activated chloride channel family protein
VNSLSLTHPAIFAALALLLLLAHAFGGRRLRRAVAWHAWPAWLEGLPPGRRQRGRIWLARGRLLLLLALAAVVAGPRVRFEDRKEVRRGVDVAVLLDASSSMTVAVPGSYAASRFAAATDAIRTFVEGRPDDRVALTTFARWPRLGCPLTADHALFDARLAAAAPVGAGSEEDRTAIGVALAAGARQLGPRGERTRVLVLVTDGVNNLGPISPEEGTRLCRDEGIRVYTIALGALGGDERFGSGAAPIDTERLEAIARATGARSFSVRDPAGLADAWRQIDALERAPLEVKLEMKEAAVAPSLAPWLLAVLVALLAGERLFGRIVP